MPSPVLRYSKVADLTALNAISESDATNNPLAYVESAYNGSPAMYGFITSSSATGNSDELIRKGAGAWIKITGHNFVVNMDNYLTTGLSTDLLENNTVCYSATNGGRFYYLDKTSTLPTLSPIIIGANTGNFIAMTKLFYAASSNNYPDSYNSNVPPIVGLQWIVSGTSPTRRYIFVARSLFSGGWLPLDTCNTVTSDPSYTPVFVGEKVLNTSNNKLFIASGTSSSSDWKLHSTGV